MLDVETSAALESGQLVMRYFWVAHGRTLAGVGKTLAYWTGEDNVAVNVVPVQGSAPVSWNFVGGGTLLAVPDIVDTIGLEARSSTYGFNHLDTTVGSPMDMIFGNDFRVARVELYRGVFDPQTWQLVSNPYLMHAGRVDGPEVNDAAIDGEGALQIPVVDSAIDLTMTNTAMSSDEQQKLRSNDRFRRWSDTAADVPYWWGMEKGA